MIAGLETVTSSLTCIVAWFARNPVAQQQVRQDPSLVTPAVEELMRRETPVIVSSRHVVRDVELADGLTLEAGTDVSLMFAAADVDPHAFPDPLTVDFARSGAGHLAFASGYHRCLGSHLARLELRTAIDQLHRRLRSYAVTPGETPSYRYSGARAATYLPLTFQPAGDVNPGL